MNINNRGYTITELLLVMGIFSILVSFAVVNLIRPQSSASIDMYTSGIVSDLRQQQIKSMIGNKEGNTQSQNFGIRFETNKYILFRGSNYNSSDVSNYEVNLDSNTIITNITLPNASAIFTKIYGELDNYSNGSNSITIRNIQTNQEKTITINKVGVPNVN